MVHHVKEDPRHAPLALSAYCTTIAVATCAIVATKLLRWRAARCLCANRLWPKIRGTCLLKSGTVSIFGSVGLTPIPTVAPCLCHRCYRSQQKQWSSHCSRSARCSLGRRACRLRACARSQSRQLSLMRTNEVIQSRCRHAPRAAHATQMGLLLPAQRTRSSSCLLPRRCAL